MENKSRRKISFNFFDIVIILLVLALAAGFVFFQKRGDSSGEGAATQKVQYQIELVNLERDIQDLVKENDVIVDKIKKLDMGNVVKCETYLMKKEGVDLATGNTIYSEVPGVYAALITIEADCTATDSALTAAGGYEIRVGTEVSVLGPGYGGGGFVVNVMRG